MCKEVPSQYKQIIDELVIRIGDSCQKIFPYVSELGNSIELFDNGLKITIEKDNNVNES